MIKTIPRKKFPSKRILGSLISKIPGFLKLLVHPDQSLVYKFGQLAIFIYFQVRLVLGKCLTFENLGRVKQLNLPGAWKNVNRLNFVFFVWRWENVPKMIRNKLL